MKQCTCNVEYPPKLRPYISKGCPIHDHQQSDNEINRYLHEALGKCWHEFTNGKMLQHVASYSECEKCNCKHTVRTPIRDNPNYLTDPIAYHELTEWAMKQEWWVDLLERLGWHYKGHWYFPISMVEVMLNPRTGSIAIAEFLKGRE